MSSPRIPSAALSSRAGGPNQPALPSTPPAATPRGLELAAAAPVPWQVALIQERLEARTQSVGIAMRERHREALLRSLLYLQAAGAQIEAGADMPDLVAEELRSSIRAVDMLVGRVDVEDLLDEIFSSFCIGK